MKYYWVKNTNYADSKPFVAMYHQNGWWVIVEPGDREYGRFVLRKYEHDDFEILGTIDVQDTLSRNQRQEAESIAAYNRGESVNLDEYIEQLKTKLFNNL